MVVRKFEGSNHAQIYARFRPTYSDDVIQEILNFLKEKLPPNDREIAVDVGCGSGQGTNRLAKYFQKCYGFDVSVAQINKGKENKHFDNVFYDVSPAEYLPTIKSNTVQLVTAFAAAHWFDFEEFFKESDRILVKNGVIAFVCYLLPGPDPTNPEDPNDKRLIDLMQKMWFDERLAPYKSPRLILPENQYQDIKFPRNYENVLKQNLIDTKTIVAEDLIGFYESWSLFQGLLANDKHLAEQCLREFTDELKIILKTNDLSSKRIQISYKYFIAMARKIA